MQSGRCPKCGNSRIATTKYVQYLGAGITGPTLRMYACADCHYVEQYMVESVESRVRVLDTWQWLQNDKGPFR